MPALLNLRDALATTSLTHLTRRQPAVRPAALTTATLLNTLARRITTATLHPRQEVAGIIPSYYRTSGPAPGAVIGIVLGSVAGFLLIIWLLYNLTQGGSGGSGWGSRRNIQGDEEIVVRRPRRNSHSQRSRRSTREEMREYSRSPRRAGRSTIVVEERRGPPVRPRSVVVESRVPGDDVVEVIEEHDEYRTRRGSRRNSQYR